MSTTSALQAPTLAEIETAVRDALLPLLLPAVAPVGLVLDRPTEWVVSEAIQDMIVRVAGRRRRPGRVS
jgi:hypothetical protein